MREFNFQAIGARNTPQIAQIAAPSHGMERLLSVVMGPPVERKYVVEGITPGTVAVLAGSSGLGKSWLAMQACFCVADAEVNAVSLRLDVQMHGATSYLSVEDDETEVDARIQAIAAAVGPEVLCTAIRTGRITIDSKVGAGATLRSPAWLAHVRALATGRVLLVVDTWARLHGGGENSNDDATEVLAPLESIARETGCAILIVAHTARRQQSDAGTATDEHARGASALEYNTRWNGILRRDAGGLVQLLRTKISYGPQHAGGSWFRANGDGVLLRVAAPVPQVLRGGVSKKGLAKPAAARSSGTRRAPSARVQGVA